MKSLTVTCHRVEEVMMPQKEGKEVVSTVSMTMGDQDEFVAIKQEGKNLGLTGYFQQAIL